MAVSDDMQCSFVPMEAVDEYRGAIAQVGQRRVAEVKKGYTPFQDCDVIFAKITPCMENGKCAIAKHLINGVGFGSTEFHVIRAGEDITPNWIFFFLRQKHVRNTATRWFRGTAGQQRVPADFLEVVQIALPSLPEQRRIAALLEKADRLRRLRHYALEPVESHWQSVFLDMFGDPATNRKGWDVAIVDDALLSSQYGTSQKSNTGGRGYPIIGMANVTFGGQIDLSSLSYVELTPSEFAELRLEPGDVIFNRTNSTELVGKTARWTQSFDAVLASYLVKLKVSRAVLPEYLVGLFNTTFYKRLFQQRCRQAIGQSNISPSLLREFPCFFPPLKLQDKYARIVNRVDRVTAQQREALRQAEHLFQTLLHRAFSGDPAL